MLAYALTVFVGAFLLFQIQPILGKFLLPWFGGAPAVWTTCLLFFQVLLLGGYLYAHVLVRRLSPRRGRAVHLALMGLAVLGMLALLALGGSPVLPAAAWRPQEPLSPVATILALLALAIGLPYFLLAATGPLMQAWAVRTHPGARVYRLYALSNAASILALVTYPPLVERFLPVRTEALVWSSAFGVFVAGSVLCAWRAGRVSDAAGPPPDTGSQRPTRVGRIVLWFTLAACGSTLLLATTNQMCQEVAAIPFLWIFPLCLYLASFVLCFQSDRIYRRGIFGPLLVVALGWAGLVLYRGFSVPIRTQVAAYSAALFAACMVCHGELTRSRPGAERLTSFYLTIAAGGAAGGLFVALLAPRIFRGYWEIHLALFSAGLLAILTLVADRGSWVYASRPWPAFLVLLAFAALAVYVRRPELFASGGSILMRGLTTGSGRLTIAAGAAALFLLLRRRALWARRQPWLAATCLAGALAFFGLVLSAEIRSFLESAVSVSRNFYGVLTVERLSAGEEDERLELRHGRIVHGFQYVSPDKQRLPTTYYGERSGIGLALLHHPRRASGPFTVGAVGLGTGTLAVYGRPGDTYRFYEINPGVVGLSGIGGKVFRYIAQSAARVQMRLGDARLSLESEVASRDPGRFDVLAVDAFSSDAIPVHLLTREALQIYLARLAPDGILALHLSNRQLDLVPVARALGKALAMHAVLVDRSAEGEAVWATTWVLLSRDRSVLEAPEIREGSQVLPENRRVRVWTDDYSNLFDALK